MYYLCLCYICMIRCQSSDGASIGQRWLWRSRGLSLCYRKEKEGPWRTGSNTDTPSAPTLLEYQQRRRPQDTANVCGKTQKGHLRNGPWPDSERLRILRKRPLLLRWSTPTGLWRNQMIKNHDDSKSRHLKETKIKADDETLKKMRTAYTINSTQSYLYNYHLARNS